MRLPRNRKRAGMTLVELMVSMIVLLVAAGTSLGALSSFAGLGDSNEQTMLAWNGLHRMVEDMYAEEFGEIYALFDDDPNNDPGGVGTAPGGDFVIGGLDPARDDADQMVGRIDFPISGLTPGQLFEDFNDAEFGMPRDLNGDGIVDGDDRAGDYALLPVRITVRWRSRTGVRSIDLQVLLLRR